MANAGEQSDLKVGSQTLDERASGFPSDSFERLAPLEAGFWWFEARNRIIEWALSKWASSARNFLEVGCGSGFVLAALARRFPDLRLSGTDFYEEGLQFAMARTPGATFYQMDARRIPFKGEFDVIGAFDVIEHIDEDEQVLFEMHGALRPQGLVFITVPQHQQLWSAADDFAQHKRRYSRRELIQKLRAAGFQLLAVRSFVSLLLPLQVAARMRPTTGEYDPTAEFKIPTATNTALRAAMSVEIALIRAGASFPWGGSLLAVARALG